MTVPTRPETSLSNTQRRPRLGERLGQLMRRLPMTAFWALVAQGIISVTRLLTTMTVGGKFGSGSETQLGYYSNGFAVLMVMLALFEAFVTTPLTVFNQQTNDESRGGFSKRMLTVAIMVIGAITAVSVLLLGGELFARSIEPELLAALIAVAALAPSQLLREFSRRWLLANMKVRSSALLEVAMAGLFGVCVFLLVGTNSVTAVTMFTMLAIINIAGLLAWWWFFRAHFRPEQTPAAAPSVTDQLNENIRFGQWVAGENVCSALTMYFSSWYLTYRLDEAAAGVFFACFTVVMLANPFLLGIASILAPRAAKKFNEYRFPGLFASLTKLGGFLMLVMILMSGLLWLAGDQITTLLFPAEYAGYFDLHLGGQNRVTATLGLALPAMGLSYLATIGLLAAHRPRDNFYSAITGLIVLIAVNLCFAETTLVTAAISFVISFYIAMACRVGLLLAAASTEK